MCVTAARSIQITAIAMAMESEEELRFESYEALASSSAAVANLEAEQWLALKEMRPWDPAAAREQCAQAVRRRDRPQTYPQTYPQTARHRTACLTATHRLDPLSVGGSVSTATLSVGGCKTACLTVTHRQRPTHRRWLWAAVSQTQHCRSVFLPYQSLQLLPDTRQPPTDAGCGWL